MLGCPWTEAWTGLRQRPWKTQSSTQGSFNQIKKTKITPRENLMPIPIIKTHILHSFAFNFSLSLSLPASDSLSLSLLLFPLHCCFLVCFPSALLWLSRSATATFKAYAVTRCLWVPFEILTYMLSGCRQEWLTGPSQSNTGLGRLAVFCQRQPRRSNKGKEQRRGKNIHK